MATGPDEPRILDTGAPNGAPAGSLPTESSKAPWAPCWRRRAGVSVVVVASADLVLATLGPFISRPEASGPLTDAIDFMLRLVLFALVAKLGLRIIARGGFGLAIGFLSFLLFVHSLALGVLLPSGRYLGTRPFLVMHITFTIIVAVSWVVTVTAAIKCMPEDRWRRSDGPA